MKHRRYVIFLDQIQGVKTTETHIRDHVQFLKNLEDSGQLELCGPFIDHKGGMVIIKADNPHFGLRSFRMNGPNTTPDEFISDPVYACHIHSSV